MTQAGDLNSSQAVVFRKNPEAVPRHDRADGGKVRRQVFTMKVGLQIPADLTFDDWEQAGCRLSGIVNSSAWWLGDWLVFGKEHYADRYQRGVLAVGLQYQTLRNYAWVSRQFEFHRRRASLSFQHHAELASLPVEEQERWLDRAEDMRWTTKQLRSAIRLARSNSTEESRQVAPTRRFVIPDNRLQRWHRAAEQSGFDLDQWVLATLDQAAEQILEEEVEEQASINA
ncbi:LmbU family transcriptional regulator [Sinosporangium siamense]|uniref:Antibiotic biosynthesis protein n=1 Tax=Sinosporangium siamense TaxID=1367973 RepID=A0A919RN36_9ACTN|nr:LmbU family transcriptional regulator [Sinosporangium siamense]GII95034.1 hypothetical protein Ssi02_52650 [Sinosporangium siamense]